MILLAIGCILALFIGVLLVLYPPRSVQAASSGHTTTMQAGAYTMGVTLSQSTPFTDQPFTVTVGDNKGASLLSGQVITQPGLGTDGANIYTPLHALAGHPGVLQATLRIPIRGAWHIVIAIDGASGQGTGTVDVIAGAPGAMPFWLAWCIGAIPALGLLSWTLRQRRLRHTLLRA